MFYFCRCGILYFFRSGRERYELEILVKCNYYRMCGKIILYFCLLCCYLFFGNKDLYCRMYRYG